MTKSAGNCNGNFMFETCGFTNNPNFIRFKWRLKRKDSPPKCLIYATEIRRMEICLKISWWYLLFFLVVHCLHSYFLLLVPITWSEGLKNLYINKRSLQSFLKTVHANVCSEFIITVSCST